MTVLALVAVVVLASSVGFVINIALDRWRAGTGPTGVDDG